MADKDLRRRTTPVFPRTRSSTNDATSRSDYDLENRSLSAAGTDPLAELERLVGEINSFVKTRADAGRGSEVNNNDYLSQSDAVEKDVDGRSMMRSTPPAANNTRRNTTTTNEG